MLKVESKIGTIRRNIREIYTLASNLENLSSILPSEYSKNIEFGQDSLTINHEGQKVTIYILAKEENNYIKFGTDEQASVKFFFWIQFKEIEPYLTKFKLTLHLDIPTWMGFMIKGKIENELNKAIDKLSEL